MAEALVSFVHERLEELIPLEEKAKCSCTCGVVIIGAIEDAKKTLNSIRLYLKYADARQGEDESVRTWVAEIREAACELEDVIESHVCKEASSKKKPSGVKILVKGYACICKIVSKIKRINAKLSDLRGKLHKFGISQQRETNEDSPVRRLKLQRTYSPVRKNDVVGLVKDVRKLGRLLLKEDQKSSHRVVSVWGNGGLGKTTIAQQVYHSEMVRNYFERFAWVCVSQHVVSKDVLLEILTKLIGATDERGREFSRMNEQEIAQRLCTTQQEKKCLVVLDDIRSSPVWDCLSVGFPDQETKSKILLTTTHREVALHVDKKGFLYEACALNDDESWRLFEKIAIPGQDVHSGIYSLNDDESSGLIKKIPIPGQDIHSDFNIYTNKKVHISAKQALGKQMLPNCLGSPLAIIVLAGVLARKNTVQEWQSVKNSVDEYIREGRANKGEYLGESWALPLSYNNLPQRLRLCLQYLGNFPDNYEIPVKRLSQLWMAEGLITPKSLRPAESMEDASYRYLNELVERFMVQVVKHDFTGNIKTCRLHHLMRKLCRTKAKDENFFHVVNSSETKQMEAKPVNKVRRLAIRLDTIGHQLAIPSNENYAPLRSLLYFVRGHFYSDKNRKLLRSLFQGFKLLRVLKFEDIKAEPEVELPSTLGNLVHLRFLSLRNSEIKQCPSSVANLVCLQTLDLRCVDWMCVKIPNVFRTMEQLRHLYLPLNHIVTEKLSLATLQNLRTLVNVSSQDCDLEDIVELTNLRKLVVYAPPSTEFKNLEEKMKSRGTTFHHLRSLSFMIGNGNGDIPMYILLSCGSCPTHLYKLHLYGRIKEFRKDDLCSSLSKLTLEETHLADGQIKLLQDLPKLRKLYLRMGAFKSETMVVSPGGFSRLEFLSLLGLCELKKWTVGEGAMPNLRSLHIGYCWGLEAVPAELQNISTLKELTINRMYRQFCNRLGEGGEDFDKIRHVPSVTITNIRQSTEGARFV